MYVCMYVCTYVCMYYVYIYIYDVHTYTTITLRQLGANVWEIGRCQIEPEPWTRSPGRASHPEAFESLVVSSRAKRFKALSLGFSARLYIEQR